MRRIATALGTLAASAMLAVTVPSSAQASIGAVLVNDQPYVNPSGCYRVDAFPPHIVNLTNETVFTFADEYCTGEVVEIIRPGQQNDIYFAASFYVH
jgi:hypothetical protein